ncbi:MAG: sporulation protein YqfD [Clostridia bacterium]|nr:sporulation protein YqfD [Clostridia bacterium]
MYLKILFGIIFGYVTIEIEGYFIERFMNLCNNQRIFLWNLKRTHSTRMLVNIGMNDFKKLKPIARKTKCRVKIQEKKGVPHLLHRYQKRKLFFLLALIIFLSILLLSNFIWNIEITGNENIPTQEIQKLLEENNFKIGKCKIGIKTKEVTEQVRLERNDIAWIGIEIKGTNAIVKIVEANLKPEIIPEDEYCNIIATKDAMIVKISAQNGTSVVKEGDIVTKGSILIGGWLEGKYTGTRYVHANGEVQAKVWYSEKAQVPLNQIKKAKTGAKENKYSVKINNFEINLSKRLSKFQKYDTIDTSKKLKLFSDFYLPIEIHQRTFEEYEEQEILYTAEEAKNIAIQEAKQKLDEKIQEKQSVINEKFYTKQTAQGVEVEVIYEVLETISTKEKIVF